MVRLDGMGRLEEGPGFSGFDQDKMEGWRSGRLEVGKDGWLGEG